VLSESETPPDRVPEGSLAPGQQVMLFGQRWWVVSTNPETEAQWREGGAVLVEIRKVR
jgi:hypothetical protein